MSSNLNATNGNFLKASATIPVLTGDFSLCFFAAQTLSAAFGTGVSLEDTVGGGFLQCFTPTTRVEDYQSNGSGLTAFPGGNFTDAQWNFYGVAHTHGTNTTVIYRGVNGGALSSTSLGDTVNFSPNRLVLYNEDANDEPVNGNILSFMFWTVVLSATEMGNQSLQLSPRVQVDKLERWIPVVDNSNAGEAYIGSSRNLTQTGSFTAQATMPSVPWRPPVMLMTG